MADCNSSIDPADPNQNLSKSMSPESFLDKNKMSNVPYREGVGGLQYILQASRPDIAYAVHSVSRFNDNLGEPHCEAVKWIMRYIKGTSFTKASNSNIVGYCDADWVRDLDERRSCTGYVFVKQSGPISWNSKRQSTVALSSAEAEYMSLSACTQEASWFRQFEMDFNSSSTGDVINILCDNKSAIDLI